MHCSKPLWTFTNLLCVWFQSNAKRQVRSCSKNNTPLLYIAQLRRFYRTRLTTTIRASKSTVRTFNHRRGRPVWSTFSLTAPRASSGLRRQRTQRPAMSPRWAASGWPSWRRPVRQRASDADDEIDFMSLVNRRERFWSYCLGAIRCYGAYSLTSLRLHHDHHITTTTCASGV